MHDERDEQHHKQARNSGHDLDRPVPQRIHAGVNNADRDKAEHDPVLDACVLVDQIVPGSMQRQHQTAVPALREIVTQRVERFIGQIGAAAQLREEIIDRFLAAVLTDSLAVEHNAPVRVDNIVVARTLESGVVDRAQHCIIIVGDGDRIIGEAAVGAAHLRAGEHEHLRLAGQRRIHNDVLSSEKMRTQIDL